MENVCKTIEDPIYEFAYLIKSTETTATNKVYLKAPLEIKEELKERKKLAKEMKVSLNSVTIEPIEHKRIFHCENSPAFIEFYDGGEIKQETWFYMGKKHRLDRPALIQYDSAGNIITELYYENGKYIPFGSWSKPYSPIIQKEKTPIVCETIGAK